MELSYYIIIILFILFLLLNFRVDKQITEKFSIGYGRSFGQFHPPHPRCNLKNNCFPGSYFTGSQYQNMCEPNRGLLRQKIQLVDPRVRKL